MTDTEFEILDELYFIISYGELVNRLTMEEDDLKMALKKLHAKMWIRVFDDPDETLDIQEIDDNLLSNSYLLASKEGLKAHNS